MCALTVILFFGGWSSATPLNIIFTSEIIFSIKVVIGAFFLY
jgi:NADH:ubiquinone oxidoreductase subunit H